MGIACNAVACYLVFRPSFRALELVFFFFLAVLSVSFVGSAVWVGFDPAEVARGLFRVEMPGRHGYYDPSHVALAMIGAVGGSLMNLVYPYFLDAKGWRGPAVPARAAVTTSYSAWSAMLVLNLSIWVLGAELLYPDRHIQQLEDLPNLLSTVLGEPGRLLFYAGIFAAIYTSIIGHAAGLGRLGTHAWLRWRAGNRSNHVGLSPSPLLSLDRHLVPGHAARMDAARHARVCRPDARRQQRPGRAAATPRRRTVVDYGERHDSSAAPIATAGGRTS